MQNATKQETQRHKNNKEQVTIDTETIDILSTYTQHNVRDKRDMKTTQSTGQTKLKHTDTQQYVSHKKKPETNKQTKNW